MYNCVFWESLACGRKNLIRANMSTVCAFLGIIKHKIQNDAIWLNFSQKKRQ